MENSKNADSRHSVKTLPADFDLLRLRKQAKLLLKGVRGGDGDAIEQATTHYRDFGASTFRLTDAQFVIARSFGFASWPKLTAQVLASHPPAGFEPEHYKDVFAAIKEGRTHDVLSMIDADVSVLDIADARQITPLTVAFAYGKLDLAFALIERGANVFAMNHSSQWGMRYIVRKDGLSNADRGRFVEASIAARVWDSEVFHAVWQRDCQRAKKILVDDPSQASVRLAIPDGASGSYNTLPYCGLTPLHYAVLAGDEAMVRVLVESNAEVDAVPHAHEPDSRHTPLYLVPEGCESIAEYLIEHGADVNHSPMYLSEGSESMRKIVAANGAGGSPLMAALAIGNIERATQILCNDPSAIHDRLNDSRIETPMHMAVKAGSAEIVDLLIKQGMNVDTPTSRGFTALALAPEMYCSLEMIKHLVQHGADVHAGNDSPLRGAIWQHAYGHWDYEQVIRFLIDKGSQPRGLWHCARGGNLALTKLLIESGADVNETDKIGFYEMVLSNEGHTPLDYCTGVVGEHTHDDIAEILRQHGAKNASELFA